MPTTAELLTPLRHERDITSLHGKVSEVAAARFDVVAPQRNLRFTLGGQAAMLHVPETLLTDSGVIEGDLMSSMTRTAFQQTCTRLGMPLQYADRLGAHAHEDVNDLLDRNINTLASVDDRTALYRYLKGDDGLALRAVLSDRYNVIDADTALTAILSGLNDSGLGLGDCDMDADLTSDRLRLRVAIPAIGIAVPDLLGDYRMPFSMREDRGIHERPLDGETPPIIWAGFEIANSDTGQGSFSVAPRAVVQICRNGLTKSIEFRRTHVGARMDDGVINWSDETRRNALTLITSQVADAVRTYCSTEYLEGMANEMRAAKGIEVESPSKAVEVVTERFGFTDGEAANVLDCFMRGGDQTAFGVANAVTAAAQLVESGDRQAEMEAMFWDIVEAPAMVAVAA